MFNFLLFLLITGGTELGAAQKDPFNATAFDGSRLDDTGDHHNLGFAQGPDGEATDVGNTCCQQITERVDCPLPYMAMSGRCIFVDKITQGTWNEMRSFCKTLSGDLAKVDDCNLFINIYDYIYAHGMQDADYWLGGTDIDQEGTWKWVDGSHIRMGAPLWNICNGEPDGGTHQNCLSLWNDIAMEFGDDACDKRRSVICEYPV